jgi:murein DD-endopeptidase MepM/ murein hydrolase activator NlpD
VRQGETLSAISVKYGVSLEALTLYNRLTDPNRIQTGMTLTVPLSGLILEWPVAGVVTSSYGRRWGRLHAGIDIAAPHGTPVHAAASGRVITSGVQRGYGRIIRLRHQGGYVTVYAHHEVNLVQMGQRVQRGQLIARVGVSGSATGPHLHFEIRQAKKPQDPTLYLPSLSPTPTAF